jgi:hypothetical protein
MHIGEAVIIELSVLLVEYTVFIKINNCINLDLISHVYVFIHLLKYQLQPFVFSKGWGKAGFIYICRKQGCKVGTNWAELNEQGYGRL